MKVNICFSDYLILIVSEHSKNFCSEISAVYCMMLDMIKNNLTSDNDLLKLDLQPEVKVLELNIKHLLYEEFLVCSSAIISFVRLLNTFRIKYKEKINILVQYKIDEHWDDNNMFSQHENMLNLIKILEIINEK